MTTSISHRDSLVRNHFDNSTELYIDRHSDLATVICEERLKQAHQALNLNHESPLTLFDIGCGGGVFSDLFLSHYEHARCLGVDLSSAMLRRNRRNPRKTLVLGDARTIGFQPGKWDLVNADAVMHHLIGNSYENTLASIRGTLTGFRKGLRDGGGLLVREIFHETWLFPSFGSRMVYLVSTSSLPSPISRLLKAVGLKTASVGVCFLAREQWRQMFAECGLTIVSAKEKRWSDSWLRWIGFRASGETHYVLAAKERS